jgi:CheY-like chemotaxis protein
MDMYMPFCTGVEVTRALRQIPEYQSLPVIYLSGETDIGQQVEALRLGGDQFLTKPANPIILSAVVKTKIERYRDMLRSGRHDSLTGLLNHSASKEQLAQMLRRTLPAGHLAVAMIDIDRFKSINDNYGHPVGDQVIRSLAWLLRGRLRNSRPDRALWRRGVHRCPRRCRYGSGNDAARPHPRGFFAIAARPRPRCAARQFQLRHRRRAQLRHSQRLDRSRR